MFVFRLLLAFALNKIDYILIQGSKFTICGDVHGQYYDLENIFKLNGMPSETNPYVRLTYLDMFIYSLFGYFPVVFSYSMVTLSIADHSRWKLYLHYSDSSCFTPTTSLCREVNY